MRKVDRYNTLKIAGAALTAVSCIPMLSLLPGGVIAVFALLGISATSAPIGALAAALAPVAQPLLLISIAMLIAGHLRCGWSPIFFAVIGGLLIYLAMYVFAVPAPLIDHAALETMPEMSPSTTVPNPDDPMAGMIDAAPDAQSMAQLPGMVGLTNEPLFYTGLALLFGSFGLGWWRRRRDVCQPLHPLRAMRAAFARRF